MSCPGDVASKAYVDGEIAQVKEAIFRLMSEYVRQSEKPQIIQASVNQAESEIMPQVDGVVKIAVAGVMFYIETQINSVKSIIGTLEDIVNGVKFLAQQAFSLAQQAFNLLQALTDLPGKVAALESQIATILSRLELVNSLARIAMNTATDALNLGKSLQSKLDNFINSVNSQINQLKQSISELRTELTNLVNSKIGALRTELIDRIDRVKADLTSSINQLKADIEGLINQVNAKISAMQAQISEILKYIPVDLSSINAKISAIESKISEILKYIPVDLSSINAKISAMQAQISEILKYIPVDLSSINAKISGLESAISNLRTSINNHINNNTIHRTVGGITNYIDRSVKQYFTGNVEYITNIFGGVTGSMDLSPILNKLNQLDAKIMAMGVSVGVILQGNNNIANFTRTTQQQTTRDAITSAAAAGTCQSLNGNCGTSFINRIWRALGSPISGNFLSGANLVQFNRFLSEWNVFYKVEWGANFFTWFNSSLKPGFDHLYNNAKNGIDRTLQVLNVALNLHNAAMLSSNVAQTTTYLVDSVLQNFGLEFKTKEGTNLSFSQVIGVSLNDFMSSIFGAEAWLETRVAFIKANRVYQAASQTLWNIRNLFSTAQDTINILADNTGKLGNAIKDWGVVGGNSFFRMPERAQINTALGQRVDKFVDKLQVIQEMVEVLTEISENVLEVQENLEELKNSSELFNQSISDYQDEATSQEEADRLASQSPSIEEIDLVKRPTE